jgi:prepilin-type N-terminal cleavage/methylation domain-containing protein
MTHVAGRNFKRRYGWTPGSGRGFSLIELLIVIALTGILAGVAVAVTPSVLRAVKGEGASTHVSTFLIRARDLAVSKRRNIQITFEAPDHLVATVRPIPGVVDPGGVDAATMRVRFEGGLEYRQFPQVNRDTPDAFGNNAPVTLGGLEPVMFTSEGTFADVNGDPINATIFVGVREQVLTANAITIMGTTAAVKQWRWNGDAWTTY